VERAVPIGSGDIPMCLTCYYDKFSAIEFNRGPILGNRVPRVEPNRGCEFYNDCFTCPFPICYEDMTAAEKRALRARPRYDVAGALHDGGCSIQEIANQIGVSRRHVQRMLDKVRPERSRRAQGSHVRNVA